MVYIESVILKSLIHTYTVALSPTGGSRQQGGEFQGFTPFHSPSLVTHRRGPFRGGGSQTPRPDICICLNRSLAPFLRAADRVVTRMTVIAGEV